MAVEGSHVCVEEQVAPDSFGYELLEEVEELVHEPAVVDYVEAVHRKGEGYLKNGGINELQCDMCGRLNVRICEREEKQSKCDLR